MTTTIFHRLQPATGPEARDLVHSINLTLFQQRSPLQPYSRCEAVYQDVLEAAGMDAAMLELALSAYRCFAAHTMLSDDEHGALISAYLVIVRGNKQ